jgi:hypothetical protein
METLCALGAIATSQLHLLTTWAARTNLASRRVRQAAALTVQVEALQGKIVAGEDIDLEQLTRLSNVLGRTLQRLGLKKPAPKRGPTLAEYLAAKRNETPL